MIICGTGHRPDKLGGYGKPAFKKLVMVAEGWLRANTPDIVISGMALGWDQALAVAAVRAGIPYHAYVPCVGHPDRWPAESQAYYVMVLKRAALVKIVHPDTYTPICMQWRNEAMVDACDTVLALWNGTPGGTANCLRYAAEKKRPVINLWGAYSRA